MTRPDVAERRPVPRIDPRIRARRIAVRRTEGRRRLQWVAVAGVVAAVVAATVGVALSPLLDVDRIRVSGAARAGQAAVLGALGIDRGDALVTLDLGAAASGVEDLPWVAEATVERSWPGTVEVSVVERVPAAAIAHEGDVVALVDVDAHVLELVVPGSEPVVAISGLPSTLEPGQQVGGMAPAAIALAAGIPEELRPRVGGIVVTAEGRLEAGLVDEAGAPAGVVRFGDGSQLGEKLRALVTMLSFADLDRLDVLDLEVPGAPALTRR